MAGDYILLDELYAATRLTSITRVRAKIQNTYKLFQASPEVQQHRGTLEEEQYEKALEQRPDYPIFSISADESGKNARFLIVGSVWFLHGPEMLSLTGEIAQWREATRFRDELHFQKIAAGNLHLYKQFVDFFVEGAATVSFKAISIDQRGIRGPPNALEELYYFLLLRGVEHEDHTRRAPLPRGLGFVKDSEESGSDKLLLARLHDRLKQAAATRFLGRLFPEEFLAVDSKGQPFIQVADLFTGALNRVLNGAEGGSHPKDDFAQYLLERVRMPRGPESSEAATTDLTVLISL